MIDGALLGGVDTPVARAALRRRRATQHRVDRTGAGLLRHIGRDGVGRNQSLIAL